MTNWARTARKFSRRIELSLADITNAAALAIKTGTIAATHTTMLATTMPRRGTKLVKAARLLYDFCLTISHDNLSNDRRARRLSMKVRPSLRGGSIAALLASFLVLASSAAPNAEPVKLRVAWAAAPGQLTPILFEHPGLAKHLGQSYVLEAVRTAGSSIGLQALAAGELEMAPMTFNVLATAVTNARLDDLRVVSDEARDGVEGYDTNLYLVHKDGPIKTVEDLKGKVVAINGIGSGQDIFMRVMLRKHHVEVPKDLTLIESNFPSMKAMLDEKKADMVVGVKPFTTDPGFQAISRTLFTQRDAVGSSDFLFLTARASFIAKNRAALVDFYEDDMRATRWFIDPANHREAVEILARFLKMPGERLDWAFTKNDFYREPNLRPDTVSIQKNIDMLRDFGFVKDTVDVAKHADLSLVEEAANRLK
jgi:sulfonate transport system substrate-binding protein